MKKISLLAAVVGVGGILSGFGSAPAMSAPSLCDAIAGNLVQNCGFETGDFTSWTQSGSLGFTGVDTFSENSGDFGVNEGPTSPGFLSQILPTSAGIYDVQVFFRSNGPNGNNFNVTFAGVQGISLVDPASFAYQPFSFSVASPGGPQTLLIGFQNILAFDQFDDVSVTLQQAAVPEPSTLGLIGLGLLGLGAMKRRRRYS